MNTLPTAGERRLSKPDLPQIWRGIFKSGGPRWAWASIGLVVGLGLGAVLGELRSPSQATPPTNEVRPAEVANLATATGPATGEHAVRRPVEDSAAAPPAMSLEDILAGQDTLERRQGLERLGLAWAKANVDEALHALQTIPEAADRQSLIRGIFHFLSSQSPQTALAKVKLLLGSDRSVARTELLAAWAPRQAVDPYANALQFSRYGSGGLGSQLLRVSPAQDELAVMWANSLDPDEGKARMLGEIAAAFVHRKSPAEALRLGDGLQGEDYVRFLREFSGAYGKVDGQAALAWSSQIADPVLRENVQQSINSNWASHDVASLRSYMETLPPGPVRESLLRAAAGEFAVKDTTAALAWAQGLPTPEERASALKIVQDRAPVGIGAQLSMEGGLPVVNALLPSGSAGMSQQMQRGDRIVGVDSFGNGFVATAGMNIEQVVELIRGRAGTSVRLQVARVNGNGFDTPRVVVLPRLQTIPAPGG